MRPNSGFLSLYHQVLTGKGHILNVWGHLQLTHASLFVRNAILNKYSKCGISHNVFTTYNIMLETPYAFMSDTGTRRWAVFKKYQKLNISPTSSKHVFCLQCRSPSTMAETWIHNSHSHQFGHATRSSTPAMARLTMFHIRPTHTCFAFTMNDKVPRGHSFTSHTSLFTNYVNIMTDGLQLAANT